VAGETGTSGEGRGTLVAFPDGAPRVLRFLPSGRSLAVAFGLVAAAAGAYVIARETSMFAVRRIEVTGAPPSVAAQVRAVLAPFDGTSLVALDGAGVERRVSALPGVASARYDRAFPHTLHVFVRPEQPVAVIRRGADAWLVSARARVIRRISPQALPSFGRVWLPAGSEVEVGQTIVDALALRAVRAVATLRAAGARMTIRNVVSTDHELTLFLGSGLEVRLGDGRDLALKLAIARRIAPQLTPPGYLDVSVPERPVAGTKSQPAGRG
jgi:cell division septal protein FtsQ